MKVTKLYIVLAIAFIGFTSCDSDDDSPSTEPTADELILDKEWTDDFGARLVFNSNGVFIDGNSSGTWSWEKSDEEPYIMNTDYGPVEVWFEFTNVTENTLNYRISATGPPDDYNFDGLGELYISE
jgi:hypothetical protein